MKKRILSAGLALCLILGLSLPAGAVSNGSPTFSDVPTTHWAYSYVERAADNGWVNGIGNGKFAPNDTLTFSQFYTMVAPVFTADELAAYQAPSGSPWWQQYMWVGANELQAHSIYLDLHSIHNETGVNIWTDEDVQDAVEKYAEQPISRSDAIAIMWRVLEKNGLDKQVTGVEEAKAEVEAVNGILPLLDDTSVPICYAAGLISGNERGEMNLSSSLTRAEGCVMLCNLVDYVTEHGGEVSTKPVNPGETTDPGDEPTNPSGELGQKLPSGATAAAGVLSSIGKDDAYPTYGNSDVVSNNGYFTGATSVDIGNASLQYEFLDMVNEARVAEGHAPLAWVGSDAAEEHSLQRCQELVSDYTHERPKGKFTGEVISHSTGSYNAQMIFDDWMASPGHKQTLMSDSCSYMTAAKASSGRDGYWIICVWDDIGVELAEQFSTNNYDYSEFIDG